MSPLLPVQFQNSALTQEEFLSIVGETERQCV